ncbi:MAG: GNAT family N-acetyltransferase [Actinomycetota bacterium]|nr:GNAT family N-acetyltransferase [Actinomycetota bacterium]
MDIELRSVAKEEIGRLLETAEAAFSEGVEDEDKARMEALLEPKRTLAAFDGDEMVAAAAVYPFTLTIPGGQAPSGGVTIVGVLPTHRRRGIVKSMMKRQLEQCRDIGEATAILWASEGAIYPHFGYGLATEHAAMELDRPSASFRSSKPPRGRTRLLSHDEALKVLPLVYDRVQAETPGMFARSPEWWDRHRLFDGKSRRDGAGPMFRVVVEIDGQPEGYALYRARSSWGDDGIHNGTLEVIEAIATNNDAEHTLWSFIFGVDLVDRVKAFFLPVDHPLKSMLADMRRLRLRVRDALWLRVVDVSKALEERSYATEGKIVFELDDAFCPWNHGVWELEATTNNGAVRKSDAGADIALTAEDLGAVYLGGNSFAQLHRAGRIEERSDGAVRAADDLFRTAKAPWCPEIF